MYCMVPLRPRKERLRSFRNDDDDDDDESTIRLTEAMVKRQFADSGAAYKLAIME